MVFLLVSVEHFWENFSLKCNMQKKPRPQSKYSDEFSQREWRCFPVPGLRSGTLVHPRVLLGPFLLPTLPRDVAILLTPEPGCVHLKTPPQYWNLKANTLVLWVVLFQGLSSPGGSSASPACSWLLYSAVSLMEHHQILGIRGMGQEC